MSSELNSGIFNRTIFIGKRGVNSGESPDKGVLRFSQFARVVTSQGSMFEPFNVNDMFMLGDQIPANFDPTDMMRRVDNIEGFKCGGESRLFGMDGRSVHDLDQWLYAGP